MLLENNHLKIDSEKIKTHVQVNHVIEVQGLVYRVDSRHILEKVSLKVREKEFLGIFGPNGGGKTTLLKLLLGFLKPSSGSIEIFGQSPYAARTHIGYVPQATNFDRKFPLSVFEVVSMGALKELTWYGGYTKKTKTKIFEALEKVHLETFAHHPFSSLSGGFTQRALLARALVSHPRLLILDEPTASVDTEAETEIHKLLTSLKKEMTILMVSHDLQTIARDADRLLYVQKEASIVDKEQICGHFALGLYHKPLGNIRNGSF